MEFYDKRFFHAIQIVRDKKIIGGKIQILAEPNV